MPAPFRAQVGQRLRYLGGGYPGLVPGTLLIVTDVSHEFGEFFCATSLSGGPPGAYSPHWWFTSARFEPVRPPTKAELGAINAQRRAIECPKANLP